MTLKAQVLKAVQELPQDAMERLYLLYKVERGVNQTDAGQKLSQAEAKERMKRWLR